MIADLQESRHVGRLTALHPLAQLDSQLHVVLSARGRDDAQSRGVRGGVIVHAPAAAHIMQAGGGA